MKQTMPKDAIALLKSDHRKVETMFEQYEKARDEHRKASIANEICTELKVHMTIEEEIFYPALKGKIDEDLYDEAYVEHDGAKVLINDIASGQPSDEFYDAKVSVLSEEIKHHVHEEEARGTGMFAQARDAGVDLVALRDEMMARKKEVLDQAKANGLPPAAPRAVNLVPA